MRQSYPSMGSPKKRGLLSSPWFYTCFIVLFGIFVFFASLLHTSDGPTVDLVLPRGSTLRSVSEQLASNGIINHPTIFRRVLQLTGGAKRVRAGEFRFQKDSSWIDAITALYFQEPVVHPITVPEGYNVRQIALLVEQQQLAPAQTFIALALSAETPKRYGLKSPTIEGYLFPDTYYFSKVDGEERIIDRMVQRFLSKMDNDIRNRIRVSGMTMEQVVTLASIIEKETGAASERPIISSVFHNRLKKGMRLQSDPTTIYGIVNFDGNLKKKHLLEYAPYNTYTIKGLPPGPIASPGIEAIRAVLSPADTKYFYFVAKAKGEHIFSETYKQHSEYVDQYQKRRPNRVSASEASKR